MGDELDYEKDVKIDLDELHLEWLKQPNLYQKYSKEFARLMKVKDKAVDRVGIVRAELDRDIRSDPAAYDVVVKEGKSITEAMVSNTILLQEAYQEATGNVIDAEYDVGVMKGVVRSFEHRRDSLSEEAGLWRNGYYSTPKYPEGREFHELVESKKEKVTTDTREKLKRKRKDQ